MSALWAVVPAAGSGTRMDSHEPKQFLMLEGRPLMYWGLAALLGHPDMEGCVVALPAGERDGVRQALPEDPRIMLCDGGEERADSVAAGLAALPADDQDWVLVHDAARPCLAFDDLQRLVQTVVDSGVGGLLAEPVTDTVKKSDEDLRVMGTVDRENLWRAQTPQMFRVGELRSALASARASGFRVTDEASAMEQHGFPVQLVSSSGSNIKVTYPEDLDLAAFWLARHARTSVSASSDRFQGDL